MLKVFNASRHGTDLTISVGLTGLEISFAYSGKEDAPSSVLLTNVEQFGSLIRSLEHALTGPTSWSRGINPHLVENDNTVWMLSGGFRQNDFISDQRQREWIYFYCTVCYYLPSGEVQSLTDYSLTLRRTEAERLLNIFKLYSL